MKSIFFRGDSRDPAQLFANGFRRRGWFYFGPQFRQGPNLFHAPDINPRSAVCVTRDFSAAPIFPGPDRNGAYAQNIWVYVLNLDVSSMRNTQQDQYQHVMKYADQIRRRPAGPQPNAAVRAGELQRHADALWPMFGQERAVTSIAARDIVGAVQVIRQFNNNNNILNGGTFDVLNYGQNPGFMEDAGQLGVGALVAQQMNNIVTAGRPLAMPTAMQGIVEIT